MAQTYRRTFDRSGSETTPSAYDGFPVIPGICWRVAERQNLDECEAEAMQGNRLTSQPVACKENPTYKGTPK
jgi:hypothetical protein